MTQEELAERAGVSVWSLRNWEIDHREPGLRPAVALARALGTTVEELTDTDEVGPDERPKRPRGRPPSHRQD